MLNLFLLASFTAPMEIGTRPQMMLWLLPLTASIAIVYKATKLSKITTGNFLKECTGLFASIIVFIVVTALVLFFLTKFVTE